MNQGNLDVSSLMSHLQHHLRDPGDGADRPVESLSRYVYVARSRRSGGLSLGVDLTPQGHCSFACVYCQASHPPLHKPDLTVDVTRLHDELALKLRAEGAKELRDLVLAGSGEPTSVPNAPDAFLAIRQACDDAGFRMPRRIFTNGRHLGQRAVADALAAWSGWGGEIWVKLDAVREDSFELVNGRRFNAAAHLAGIRRLAQACPIGLQIMLFRGPGIPAPAQSLSEIAEVIASDLAAGARIREVHIITLSRVPSNPASAASLQPIEADELAGLGAQLAARTGLPVSTFPAH